MSTHIIKKFVNNYKHVLVSKCIKNDIKYIPFPKNPINTDCLIEDYSNNLHIYIRTQFIQNPHKYVFKPVSTNFPNEYFRYESI